MEYLSGKKKSYKKWFLLVLLILIAIIFYGRFFVKTSLPPMEGELEIKSLRHKVSVIRDRYGIPHIKAENNIDAYRALGFVVASERLFQMDMQRRMASGELAEIFGVKLLKSDKLFRTLGLRARMQELIRRKNEKKLFDPKMLSELDAFYEGVNAYIERGKLPLEYSLLRIKPRPFTALDAYTFVGLMSFNFAVATSEEPLMTKLRTRLGSELADELRNDLSPYEEKQKTLPVKKRVVDHESHYPVSSLISDLEHGFSLFDGSNGWILAAKRSASGFPMLINDPHITFSHPGIWFEAHLSYPGFETYGHYLPLIPYPVLSHNRERAWGLTMSLIDDMDLYKEKIDPATKTYEFKGKNIPYHERFERIAVKKMKPVELLIVETHHGPVLDPIYESGEEKSLALKWSFLNPDNDPLTSLYLMSRSKSMEEFKAAVATGVAPGLNVLYADKKNIGWWIFGEIAKKSKQTPTDFILDGAGGKDEYLGVFTFNEKPHLENPASGIIVSANARPVGTPTTPDDLRGDWQPDDRYKTLSFLLNQKEVWSVPEMKEMQTLALNLENKLILNALLEDVNFQNLWKKEIGRSYIDILRKWDFISDANAIAPSLYYTWCREIMKSLLQKDLGLEEFETFSKLPNGWNFLKRVALNRDSLWWKKFDRKKIITDSFNNAIESLRQELGEDSSAWTWGHLHTIEFVHPIGRQKPLDKLFNVGPVGLSGAAHEINNQKQSGFAEGFKVKVGPSTRNIVDMKNPETSWGILPVGNSGHRFSPFFKDQLDMYVRGEYREQWMNHEDIVSNKLYELILAPVR